MQLRFLDDETALRVMEKIRFPDGAPYSIDEKMLRECWVEFENGNWDVRCSFTAGPKNTSADRSAYLHEYGGYYLVELKPIIGDDYPSVLRKVKQRANPRDEWGIVIQGGTRVVICDRFESTVATLGQVKQLFEKSDVKFLQWSEIEPVKEQCK